MIKIALTRLAAIAATLSLLATAFGGETLLQRTAIMISSPHIAIDLKLSATQVTQRDMVLATFAETRDQIVKKMEAGPASETDARQEDLNKAQALMDSQLLAILSPAQLNRLKQIAVQQFGTEALEDDAIAKELALTPAQRAKVKAIHAKVATAQDAYDAALGEAIGKIPDPGSDESAIKAYTAKQQQVVKSMEPRQKQYLKVRADGDAQILAALTPAQKAKWKAMSGKPVKLTR